MAIGISRSTFLKTSMFIISRIPNVWPSEPLIVFPGGLVRLLTFDSELFTLKPLFLLCVAAIPISGCLKVWHLRKCERWGCGSCDLEILENAKGARRKMIEIRLKYVYPIFVSNWSAKKRWFNKLVFTTPRQLSISIIPNQIFYINTISKNISSCNYQPKTQLGFHGIISV